MRPTFDLTSPTFKADPFPTLTRLRAEGPAVRVIFGDHKPAWMISRYADVAAAIKDPRLGKDYSRLLTPEQRAKQKPWMPGFMQPLSTNMLERDPPDHTRLRALVHLAFTPQRVEALRARIEALCAERLADVRRRGAMDVVEDYALPVPLWVICEMLGVPEGDRRKFRGWTNRLTAAIRPFDMLLAIPALWSMLRYMRKLVRTRRGAAADDLLSALQRVEQAGDRLSEDELLAMIFLLLVAGHETTVNLIASGTLALLDQPAALERLRAEPALIKPAVEELLRFTSPVEVATERYTAEEVEIDGVTIPRGERVLLMLMSANHDPSVFADPQRLKLDREPNRHLALGGGSHYCLGAPLARLEGQIALSALVRELPDLALAIPRGAVRWRRSILLRGLAALPVSFSSGSASRPAAAKAS